MTVKISKKTANGLHAAIDELIAANPEAATALSVILENLMGSETAIDVPASRKGGKKKPSADLDEDELDGEDEGDDEGDELDEDEDELDEAPKRGRGKAASTKAPARGRGKAKVEEVEEDDEAVSEGEIDLDDLEAETITEAFENFEPSETHERVSGGVREMTAAIDTFGFDVPQLLKEAKAKSLSEKKEVLSSFLSRIHFTIDAINAFDLESVLGAIEEAGQEGFTPKGRGAAKELAAATELFRVAIFGADE